MGEEKKEGKDIKKLKYEQPRLVNLSGAGGTGQGCEIGSGDDTCDTGNVADRGCVSGNGAEGCDLGNGAEGCGPGDSPG